MSELAHRWSKLPPEKKEKYKKRAAEEKEKYAREIEQYEAQKQKSKDVCVLLLFVWYCTNVYEIGGRR